MNERGGVKGGGWGGGGGEWWKAMPLGYDGRRPSGEIKSEFGGKK